MLGYTKIAYGLLWPQLLSRINIQNTGKFELISFMKLNCLELEVQFVHQNHDPYAMTSMPQLVLTIKCPVLNSI